MYSNSARNLGHGQNRNGPPSPCVHPTKPRHPPPQEDRKVADPLEAPPPREERKAVDLLEALLRQRREQMKQDVPSYLPFFPTPTSFDRAAGAGLLSAPSLPSSSPIVPSSTPSASYRQPVFLENLKEWPYAPLKRWAAGALAADDENASAGSSLSSFAAIGSMGILPGKAFEEILSGKWPSRKEKTEAEAARGRGRSRGDAPACWTSSTFAAAEAATPAA